MSEERKTKTDAAAPASAALGRIDRKDAFLQALHTFLTAHQGTEWAVAAVDIQHFKLYNELYGTEKGDALLETVANCLLGYSRQTGYPVGYFGNDDFFLCLPDEKAEQTAVLATLQACMAAGRQDVTFFMVMGVCPVQANPGADAATLCNYAQIAGVTTDSGYLHRFEPTMLNELKEQQQLLGELERALDNHEFCFFLQPKCNSITRAIVGMEALVRWNHPTRGCVPPCRVHAAAGAHRPCNKAGPVHLGICLPDFAEVAGKRQQPCAGIGKRFGAGYPEPGCAADLCGSGGKI